MTMTARKTERKSPCNFYPAIPAIMVRSGRMAGMRRFVALGKPSRGGSGLMDPDLALRHWGQDQVAWDHDRSPDLAGSGDIVGLLARPSYVQRHGRRWSFRWSSWSPSYPVWWH